MSDPNLIATVLGGADVTIRGPMGRVKFTEREFNLVPDRHDRRGRADWYRNYAHTAAHFSRM